MFIQMYLSIPEKHPIRQLKERENRIIINNNFVNRGDSYAGKSNIKLREFS